MTPDTNTERTKDKLNKIEMWLKCIRDLNLLDDSFDETWKEGTDKFLDKYEDKKSFYDLPLEERCLGCPVTNNYGGNIWK